MDIEQRTQVAEAIKAARGQRGWSQERLAREAKVSPNTILSIETGQRTPQEGKLRAVLDALDLAPPSEGDSLDLAGVPDDARIFLTVAARRFAVLDEPARMRLLADLYPRFIDMG